MNYVKGSIAGHIYSTDVRLPIKVVLSDSAFSFAQDETKKSTISTSLRHLKPNSNISAFPNYFNRVFVILFQLTFINKNSSSTSRAYIAAPPNEHGASRGLLFRILIGVFLLANYWIAGWPLWAFSAFRSLVSLMSSRTCSTISTLNKTKTARVPSGHQNTATFLTGVILFEVWYCWFSSHIDGI